MVDFDKNGIPLSIEEKLGKPESNFALTVLYFNPNSVVEIAKYVKPSGRGELGMTSLNQKFLIKQKLEVES